jgi:hypothetical protein
LQRTGKYQKFSANKEMTKEMTSFWSLSPFFVTVFGACHRFLSVIDAQ